MKKAVMTVVLVLLIPILLGRVTTWVLQKASPPPAMIQSGTLRAQGDSAIAHLQHTRGITRIALGVIGVYYVGLVTGWVVLRKKKSKASAQTA